MSTGSVSVDYDARDSLRIATLLDDDRRLATLTVLVSAPKPVPEDALALAVAVRTADAAPTEVDDETLRSVRLAHHHSDLPRLEDAGIVERDVGERAVTLTDPGRELAREVLDAAGEARATSSTGDEQARLGIIVALSANDAPVGLRSLAEALIEAHESWDDLETAAIRLHHVCLPCLDDAGVLSYDPIDKRVELP